MKINSKEQDKGTVINTMFMLLPLDKLEKMYEMLQVPTYARKNLHTVKTILMLAPIDSLKATSMYLTGVEYDGV